MERKRRYSAIVVFAAVVGMATLLIADVSNAQSSSPPKYVALGSSFAAGPRIPDTIDPGCGRSSNNYAHQLATKLRLALTDASCQGATTDGVLTTQLAAVTPDTKYVTITIGGNNIDYSVSTILCAAKGAQGTSCLGNGVDSTAIATKVQSLEVQLTDTLRAIKKAAPSASVFLVAYPRVVPGGGKTCAPQDPMLPQDSKYISDLGTKLQQSSMAAAKTAKVTFIDAYTPKNHDVCAPEAQRWIEGNAPESPAFPFHPNQRAMQAEADMIVKALKIKSNKK